MTRVSAGVRNFRSQTQQLAQEAGQDGRNITKREVAGALAQMVASDTLSAADRKEAERFLEKDVPLTRGARALVQGIATNDPGAVVDVLKQAMRLASDGDGVRAEAAALMEAFERINRNQTPGEYVPRFLKTDANSLFPSKSELTPEEAMLELMNGNEVGAQSMEYRRVGTGKRGSRRRTVRTKVGDKDVTLGSLTGLTEWWDYEVQNLTGDYGSRGTPPARSRVASHNGKRWG